MICCDMLLFLYVMAFRVLRYICTALRCIFVVLNGLYKYIWVELSLWIELVLLTSVIEIAMCLYYWLSMYLNRSVNPEASQHLTTHVSNNSIRMKQLHTAVVRVSALHTLLFMLIMWRVLPSEAFAVFPCITSLTRLYLYRVPSWAYISLISQNTFCWATQNGRRDLNDPAVDSNRRDSGGGSKWGISCNSEVMTFSYSEHIAQSRSLFF